MFAAILRASTGLSLPKIIPRITIAVVRRGLGWRGGFLYRVCGSSILTCLVLRLRRDRTHWPQVPDAQVVMSSRTSAGDPRQSQAQSDRRDRRRRPFHPRGVPGTSGPITGLSSWPSGAGMHRRSRGKRPPTSNRQPLRRTAFECLHDLLRQPFRGRVPGHRKPNQLPATMAHDQKGKQALETSRLEPRTDQSSAIASAWLRRNVRQVCDGGPRCLTMYLETVDLAMVKPSFSSSPWIRGAPHNGLSLFIRRTSSRSSRLTFGRPG